MKLSDKTILITGGATGIGFALASVLATRNNKVIITGRKLEALEEAKKKIPTLIYFQSDISDSQSVDALFDKLKENNITVDVLFNNAGVLEVWDIAKEDMETSLIFSKINTNLTGAIVITQRFIRQADKLQQNAIINMSTEAAILSVPILPLYSASKAGLNAFTVSLRQQFRNTNFRIIEITPPAVETKMTTVDMQNTTKLVSPKDFAVEIVRNIEAGKLNYAPSSNAIILKLLRRFLPNYGIRIIDKVSRKQLLGTI
jgi:uncharacterized oxidoreductase